MRECVITPCALTTPHTTGAAVSWSASRPGWRGDWPGHCEVDQCSVPAAAVASLQPQEHRGSQGKVCL